MTNREIKQEIKLISITFGICVVVSFLITSFILKEINPFDWSALSRGLLVVSSAVTFVVVGRVYAKITS